MKGHIRKRGKRSWAVIIELDRDQDGKRRQKWISVQGLKKDAEAELTRQLAARDNGTFVEPSKLTVREYLAEWLKAYAKPNVAGKTYERYEEICNSHLAPALGHLKLLKLQPLHIQDYYTEALTSGRKNGKGALSAQTVLHHHRVLKGALSQAVRWRLIKVNPVEAVEPPRPKRQEMRALNESQTAELLNLAQGRVCYLPVLIAVTTGLRRGEICGLRWADINLKQGTLSVRQSLEQTRDGLQFKAPKTAKGRRTVALPSFTVDALRQHKVEQKKGRLMVGPRYENRDLVIAEPDGKPYAPDTLTSAFRRMVAGTSLQGLRFHDLRHTHATQLLRQGVHPKIVSERLGHATVSITLDTYSHVLPGMQEDAAVKFDAALRNAITKRSNPA